MSDSGDENTSMRVVRVRKHAQRSLIKKAPEQAADPAARPESNTLTEDPFTEAYRTDVVEPPYDLAWLSKAHEHNSILGPCVQSMALNTVGFGYHLEPTVDLDKIPEGPKREQLKVAMEAEKEQIETFFDYAHVDKSYNQITTNRAFDKHLIGNGYMEVIRFFNGDISGLEHAQAFTMRLMKQDPNVTNLVERFKVNKTDYAERLVRKKFRRFVQIKEGKRVYFKEFGDPRVVDADTGEYLTQTDANGRNYPVVSLDRLKEARRATEILHFAHYCPYSPYGVPVWMGNVLSVTGARAYEEINANFADNKAIPPLVVTVSGGNLSGSSVERLEKYVEENLKGRDNFHRILILETDAKADPNLPPGQTARGAINVQPLTSAIQSDEIFSKFDDRSRKKVRGAFRLPPIYTGDTDDYTRATAEEASSTAEKQVFSPERLADDFIINRKLFTALKVRYWKFVSNTSVENSPIDQAELYVGIRSELTMNEAREMIAGILNKEFVPLTDEWAKKIPLGQMALLLGIEQSEKAAERAALQQAPELDPGKEQGGKEQDEEAPEAVEKSAKAAAVRIHLVKKALQDLADDEALFLEDRNPEDKTAA